MNEPREETIAFPPYRLCDAEKALQKGERKVRLKPKAYAVLKYLLEQHGRVVPHAELMTHVWGPVHVGEAVIKNQIGEIRRALRDTSRDPRFIETSHGRGYRFIAPVHRPTAAGFGGLDLSASPALGRAQHFVGRDKELILLNQQWHTARRGKRRAILVSGEAGSGKTALLSESLFKHFDEAPALLAWGSCMSPHAAASGDLPIIEAINRACKSQHAGLLRESLQRYAPSWAAGGQPSRHANEAGVNFAHCGVPERSMLGICEALEAFAGTTPLFLLIEDLHWADPSTLLLLRYLAQRSDAACLLVVCTYRQEHVTKGLQQLVETLSARRQCLELVIDPLHQHAVVDFLHSRLGHHTIPKAAVQIFEKQTAGHCQFMVEVLESWITCGLLRCDQQGHQITAPLKALAHHIPIAMARRVQHEIERLSTLERRVLEAASVAGFEFSIAAIATALEEPTLKVEDICLRVARRGRFLRCQGVGELRAEWAFKHAIEQQIICESMGPARRAHLLLRMGAQVDRHHRDTLRTSGQPSAWR